MRKLVHEEIDREIVNKSVNLAYRFVGKPTAKAFLKALSIFPGMPAKAAGKKTSKTPTSNTNDNSPTSPYLFSLIFISEATSSKAFSTSVPNWATTLAKTSHPISTTPTGKVSKDFPTKTVTSTSLISK